MKILAKIKEKLNCGKKTPYENYGKVTIKEVIRIGKDIEIIEEFELKRREALSYIDGLEALIRNISGTFDIEKATLQGYYEGVVFAKSGKVIKIQRLDILTRLSEECIMMMGSVKYSDGTLKLIDITSKIVW